MISKQMDMTAYRKWLYQAKKKGHLEIALKKILEVDHSQFAAAVLRDLSFGVWSGWSM